jgi:DNA-binding NarL/FixJ family response regulator
MSKRTGSAVTGEPNGSAPILIVDSEESARKRASDVLMGAGYTALQAVDGENALEMARRERPCAVILEVCLPGISGYEVCRKLRETFGDSLSIIFLSGVRKESFDRVAGLLLGADEYLAKPFAPDELLARVEGLIRRSAVVTLGSNYKLTKRELDVLRLLAQGLDQKEVASRLFISSKTVGTHTEHIFTKLGVHSRSQAVALAYREDLVERGWPRSLALAPVGFLADDFFLEWLNACGTALAG